MANEYPADGLPTWNISYHTTAGIDDAFIQSSRPKLESYSYGYNLEIKYLYVTADILYSLIHDTRPVNLSIRESGLENMNYQLPNTIRKLDLRGNKLTELPVLHLGLNSMDCSGNKIERLDTLPDSLHILICNNNPLRSLNISNPISSNLQELDCSKCSLTWLPELPQGLLRLKCSCNPGLTKLPQIPATLEFLNCSICSLHELPEFPVDSKLKELKCTGCDLTNLPPLPPKLEILKCHCNKLTYLPTPLPDTLTELVCSSNYLASLPIPLPNSIVDLNCSSNKITRLPPDLSSLSNLDSLHCSANKLIWLPELPASLTELNCRNNNLSVFPMQIPIGLTWLDCRDNTQLQWLPPLPHGLSYARLDTVPLPLDASEDFAEITPETITYINREHEYLFRKWLSDHLDVYRTELLERQLEITMNPDRISRLIQNGEIGPIGTWNDTFS